MIEHVECGVCGSSQIFLRKKGMMQIGMYCANCGKWHKWVGKKSLSAYKARGFKVYDESYEPSLAGSAVPDTSDAFDNVPVNERVRPTTNSLLGIEVDDSEPNFGSEESYDHYGNDVDTDTGEILERERCMTCLTGTIDCIGKSEDATLSIFDGVMMVQDKRGTKLYGSFKAKYCPTCGVKL